MRPRRSAFEGAGSSYTLNPKPGVGSLCFGASGFGSGFRVSCVWHRGLRVSNGTMRYSPKYLSKLRS